MEALQWSVGILVTINIGVTSFLARAIMAHERECKHVNARVAILEANCERMQQDIGTHDSGMRGHIHDVANEVTEIEKRLYLVEHQK